MQRTPVSSSNLHSVGYDAATQTLEIAFQNGRIYQYFDVPIEVYNALMSAESHGRFFIHNIKEFYHYRQIKK